MLHSLHWNLPGGPLIWDNQKIESSSLTSFLVSTLKSLSRENNLIEIQLNTSPFGPELDETCLFRSGFQVKQENFTHLLNIQQGYDAVWRAFNKRVRGAVRKANKNEVILSISNSEKDMQSFYRIYLSLMKNFNSPPKPYSLMKALQKSSIGSLVVAKHNNIVIGGILILHYNKTLTLWAMASRAQSRHLRPNNALIDFTIRWACDKKYSWVDFGASPPERVGLVKFKENWRAEKRKFFFYQWVRSSGRYRLWSCAEPPLRSLYGRLQGLRYRRQLQE
jgi:lipid II:glycine glycyltransferase (peptidoglycan interpeptide bridge formation enzyme)